jgi:hypothetical protein
MEYRANHVYRQGILYKPYRKIILAPVDNSRTGTKERRHIHTFINNDRRKNAHDRRR